MKKSVGLGIIALALFLSPLRVQAALLDNPQIISVIRIDADTCALEVQLPDLLGLPFNLKVAGNAVLNLVASLTGLVLDAGDILLLATPSFEVLADVDADIEIDESLCVTLVAGADIKLLTTGLTVLDSIILPDGFDDLTALLLNPIDGVLALVDLNTDSTEVENSGGGGGTVGPIDNPDASGGDSGGGNGTTGGVVGQLPNGGGGASGGCSLNASAPASSGALAALMGLSLCLVVGLGRRAARHCR